jgi:hypothetical protein
MVSSLSNWPGSAFCKIPKMNSVHEDRHSALSIAEDSQSQDEVRLIPGGYLKYVLNR